VTVTGIQKTSNDRARAILSDFGFAGFDDRRGWVDDESFLWRLVATLSDGIKRALPAI